MKDRNTSKKTAATDQDPATAAHQKILQRQRFLIERARLKRRRRKSHQ